MSRFTTRVLPFLCVLVLACDPAPVSPATDAPVDAGTPADTGSMDAPTADDTGTTDDTGSLDAPTADDAGTTDDGGAADGGVVLRENDDTLCANGLDDDGDGLVDCADDSCHGHPFVTVCVEDCTTTTDDDLDGYVNCDDNDCYDTATCLGATTHEEAGATECGNGLDDDGDGFTDCADFSCQGTVESCNESTMTTDNCSDGIDNNSHSSAANFGDYVDCSGGTIGGDRQCEMWGRCAAVEATDAQCSDGIDNDGDGFVDCADLSCQRSLVQSVCDGNAVTCSDGLDNEGNGFVDCDDFACRCCPSEGDSCAAMRATGTCPACL